MNNGSNNSQVSAFVTELQVASTQTHISDSLREVIKTFAKNIILSQPPKGNLNAENFILYLEMKGIIAKIEAVLKNTESQDEQDLLDLINQANMEFFPEENM